MDDHLQCVKLILDHEVMFDIGSLHNLRAEPRTDKGGGVGTIMLLCGVVLVILSIDHLVGREVGIRWCVGGRYLSR